MVPSELTSALSASPSFFFAVSQSPLPPKPKPEKPKAADPDDVTLDDLSHKAITDVFGENLNLLDDAGRKLLGVFLRKAPKPPGAGDKVKVHQETDDEAIRTDYLKLNWDDYTYTRTRKRKAVQAPAAT